MNGTGQPLSLEPTGQRRGSWQSQSSSREIPCAATPDLSWGLADLMQALLPGLSTQAVVQTVLPGPGPGPPVSFL